MRHFAYIVLLFCFTAAAQKASEKQAHSLFAKKSYVKAAAMYEQLKPSQKVLANMGDAYYYNGEADAAVRAYGQLFFSFKDSLDPEYSFRYAHALMGTGDYPKADIIMGEYLKYVVN